MSLLLIATGLGFAAATSFWPLMVVAFVGTLNPSGGDVSVFLPTEQALLPGTAPDAQRTALFARYSLIGALVAARRRAVRRRAGVARRPGRRRRRRPRCAGRSSCYAALGVVILVRYRTLSPAIEPTGRGAARRRSARRGRSSYRLAALFSLDAFGGGFVLTALVVLWLQQRFDLSIAVSGAMFFWAGVLLGVLGARRGADRRRASASSARWSSRTSRRTAS